MKRHTTKLTKIMAVLLVLGVALAVAGFVLKSTSEPLVYIAYVGIALAVVGAIMIYKEDGRTTITRPGEIVLPLGSTKDGYNSEVKKISVLFSEVSEFKVEENNYVLTLKSGSEVVFRMTTYSTKTKENVIAIIKERIAGN